MSDTADTTGVAPGGERLSEETGTASTTIYLSDVEMLRSQVETLTREREAALATISHLMQRCGETKAWAARWKEAAKQNRHVLRAGSEHWQGELTKATQFIADSGAALNDTRAALAQAEERTAALVRVVEQAIDWIEMPIQAYSLKWGVDWQYGSDPMPHWTELKRVLAAAGRSSGGGGER